MKTYNRDTQNWQALRFNDCRRSSQKIIDAYSKLRTTGEHPIKSASEHESNHPIKIIFYEKSNIQELVRKYEGIVDPKLENRILVRGDKHLSLLGEKMNSLEPWKNPNSKKLIEAKYAIEKDKYKIGVDLIRVVYVEVKYPDLERHDNTIFMEGIKSDKLLNSQLFNFLTVMPTIDDSIRNWTTNIETFIKQEWHTEVDLGLKKNKGEPFYNQNIKQLYYPPVTNLIPVSTIHRVKGMTFDSVLLILNEDRLGSSISIDDFSPPSTHPNERQRMIYVAMSRPKKLACIGVPSNFTPDKVIAILGDDIEIVS